jgi:S-adenosylhomocysteine hydrolase
MRFANRNDVIDVVQNEVAAAIAMGGTSVYAWRGQTEADYWWCIDKTIADDSWQPNMVSMRDVTDLTVSVYEFDRYAYNVVLLLVMNVPVGCVVSGLRPLASSAILRPKIER